MLVRALALVLVVVTAAGCPRKLERTLVRPEDAATLDDEAKYLKVHMRDGGLYVLSEWSVDERRRVVMGTGDRFDARRQLVATGMAEIAIADVVLFETNVVKTSGVVAAMAVVTGLSLAVTVACAVNPKACFGSCPTFYVPAEEGGEVLAAEGFSASIAPSLEARDVDHLFRARRAAGGELVVRLTNEAYETHVIRYAHLIAARPPEGGRVLADREGRLWAASELRPVRACRAAEGDCGAAVAEMDGVERWSRTDGRDLGSREMIELEIDGDGERGLVIGARQTFLTTFLLYQGLSYLGSQAGDALAALERGGGKMIDGAIDMQKVLGGIAVEVEQEDGRFEEVGVFDETGPLAADVQVVRLPRASGRKVRLRITRGHYRIDMLAVARLGGEVKGVELEPALVERRGRADGAALAALASGEEQLVTFPGDEYRVHYRLPPGPSELFLASRGYYLEWMREEWLREESRPRAALFLLQPRLMLRLLAPSFRKVEDRMEEMFWNSRYAPRRREHAR